MNPAPPTPQNPKEAFMASNVSPQETTSQPNPEKRSSTAAKLLQAAALAAVLVPLGSVAVETTTITCGFSGASSDESCSAGEGETQTYNFDGYKYILTFFGTTDAFEIQITDMAIDPFETFSTESLSGDYDCIPISGGTSCVEFQIVQTSGTPSAWGTYEFTIAWDFPTDPFGSEPPGPDPSSVRVLSRSGNTTGEPFTVDMCLAFPDPGCSYFAGVSDPEISSGDTDFSTQIPAILQVPEPAVVLLVGSGLGGILYRRRCRRLDSAPSRIS